MFGFTLLSCFNSFIFFFSSRRRHTICALVTGVQTCALPIFDPKLEWRVSLVKQAVTPGPHFNAKAARAKLMARSGSEDGKYEWGPGVAKENRAHGDDKMTCFTCHLSWTTSCGGCHLPIEANWKTKSHHFEAIGRAHVLTPV